MLKTIFTGLACSALLACAPVATTAEPNLNTLTDQEKEDGWVLLFDGKSMEQWRNYRISPWDHDKVRQP